MSLVGSLEDLGLVDILQIVSLARKSGMLTLRSESGDGRIVLSDGLVQCALVKGEVEDLRSLLIAEDCLDAEAFEQAEGAAETDAIELDEALERVCGLDAERLAGLRRGHVEHVVMRMFGWRTGEFSFEICEEPGEQIGGLMLASGLNTQYLAMEATRLGDEAVQPEVDAAAPPAGDEASDPDEDGVMFSGEAAVDAGTAADAVAEATLDAVDGSCEVSSTSEGADIAVDAPSIGETRVPVSVVSAESPAAPAGTLVAIDTDLSTLEWLKASVDGLFARAHIFQRRDAALVRIRQYLVRGTVPIVVMADTPADRSGPDADDFVERLRSLAPTMPVLELCAENDLDAPATSIDGVLRRPASPSADPDRWHLYEPIAEKLRSDLAPWVAGDRADLARR